MVIKEQREDSKVSRALSVQSSRNGEGKSVKKQMENSQGIRLRTMILCAMRLSLISYRILQTLTRNKRTSRIRLETPVEESANTRSPSRAFRYHRALIDYRLSRLPNVFSDLFLANSLTSFLLLRVLICFFST